MYIQKSQARARIERTPRGEWCLRVCVCVRVCFCLLAYARARDQLGANLYAWVVCSRGLQCDTIWVRKCWCIVCCIYTREVTRGAIAGLCVAFGWLMFRLAVTTNTTRARFYTMTQACNVHSGLHRSEPPNFQQHIAHVQLAYSRTSAVRVCACACARCVPPSELELCAPHRTTHMLPRRVHSTICMHDTRKRTTRRNVVHSSDNIAVRRQRVAFKRGAWVVTNRMDDERDDDHDDDDDVVHADDVWCNLVYEWVWLFG